LARKVLDQAAQTKDNPVDRFVLIQTAKDLAVLAGDAEAALEAVDRVVRNYDVDPLQTRIDCLKAVTGSAKVSSQREALAEQALSLMDVAVAQDNYQAASQLGRLAQDAAVRTRNYALRKETVARMKQMEELKEAYTEYRKAMALLEEAPTDAAANLAAGRYLCLVRGDWDAGVAMLALGSDPALKAVATKELQGATSPEAQVVLGDDWWDLAGTREGREKEALLLRAGYWYRRAGADLLSGLVKLRVQKRLEEIAKIPDPVAARPGAKALGVVPVKATVVGMEMVPLSSEDPALIPEELHGAQIAEYATRPRTDVKNGVLNFTVHRKGLAYLQVNYGYQGNRSGGWYEERLTREQLVQRGWEDLGECPWNKDLLLFKKVLEPGEYRIRTNKYSPPRLIIPPSH
jgi:hypothetical protein